MSRAECLIAQGAMAEKKRRVRELETEIEGLIVVIRSSLAPFMDFDMMKPELAKQSAKQLYERFEERKKLLAEIAKISEDWGE